MNRKSFVAAAAALVGLGLAMGAVGAAAQRRGGALFDAWGAGAGRGRRRGRAQPRRSRRRKSRA